MKVERPSEKFSLVALMLPHLDICFTIAWQIRNKVSKWRESQNGLEAKDCTWLPFDK